jgi:hypothetical protein
MYIGSTRSVVGTVSWCEMWGHRRAGAILLARGHADTRQRGVIGHRHGLHLYRLPTAAQDDLGGRGRGGGLSPVGAWDAGRWYQAITANPVALVTVDGRRGPAVSAFLLN